MKNETHTLRDSDIFMGFNTPLDHTNITSLNLNSQNPDINVVIKDMILNYHSMLLLIAFVQHCILLQLNR